MAVDSPPIGTRAVGTCAGSLVGPAARAIRLAGPHRLTRAQVERRELFVGLMAGAVDLLGVLSGYLLSRQLRVGEPLGAVTPLNYGRVILTVPLWLIIFAVYDLYDRRKIAAASEEAGWLVQGVAVAVVVVVFYAFFLDLLFSRGCLACVSASCL